MSLKRLISKQGPPANHSTTWLAGYSAAMRQIEERAIRLRDTYQNDTARAALGYIITEAGDAAKKARKR